MNQHTHTKSAPADSLGSPVAPAPHSRSLYVSPGIMHRCLHRFVDLAEADGRINQDAATKYAECLDVFFPFAEANVDLFVKAMLN